MCLSWPGCTERRANLCHQAPSLRPGPKNPAGCLSSFVANKFFALKKHHLVEKLAWVEGHFFLFLLVCLFLDRCPTARRTDWRCQMGNPGVSCRSWCSVNLSPSRDSKTVIAYTRNIQLNIHCGHYSCCFPSEGKPISEKHKILHMVHSVNHLSTSRQTPTSCLPSDDLTLQAMNAVRMAGSVSPCGVSPDSRGCSEGWRWMDKRCLDGNTILDETSSWPIEARGESCVLSGGAQ